MEVKVAKLTEDEKFVLQYELQELKELIPTLSADMSAKFRIAEVAGQKFMKAKARAEKLEYILAQEDGRLKVIRTGHSGIKKTKKKSEKKFDLAAYTKSLTPEAREAFMRELLNS
jgi:hypothetical protein